MMSDRKDADLVEIAVNGKCTSVFIEIEVTEEMAIVSTKVEADVGCGWIAGLFSFLIFFVSIGLPKAFSGVYSVISDEYAFTTPETPGWLSGLIGTLTLVLFPIVEFIIRLFGTLPVVYVSGLLFSLGLIISFFETSTGFLIGSLSVCLGVGLALFTNAVVCWIGKYFTAFKRTALAIAWSGGCAGAVALPLAIEIVLQFVGLWYTFRVLATVFSVICLIYILFYQRKNHSTALAEEIPFVQIQVESKVANPIAAVNISAFSKIRLAISLEFLLSFLSETAFILTTSGVIVSDAVCTVTSVWLLILPVCFSQYVFIWVMLIAAIGSGIWIMLISLVLNPSYNLFSIGKTVSLLRFLQGIAMLIYPAMVALIYSNFGVEAGRTAITCILCVGTVVGIALCLSLSIRLRK